MRRQMQEHHRYIEYQYRLLKAAEKAIGLQARKLESLAEAVKPQCAAKKMGRVEQSESSDYERKSTEAPSIRDQFARSSCLQRQIQGEKGVYGQLHNSHEKNSSLQRRYTDKVFCDPLRKAYYLMAHELDYTAYYKLDTALDLEAIVQQEPKKVVA
ncbi:unnamed protein product [Peronospora belbahrii]|uniref:Uncharacterized protein n=1 Tax=Peronospora belbahrii TaxID=622444 RepID=A0AAU9KKU8_9STRA|nr:unnamed protein product [Peronospora belbahrii]